MSNPWVVALVSVALIAGSAFFVAVEFALIAARRHRLSEQATTSRSARAALRSASDLSLLLAGSQLGITVCTLALGAVTKPAVHYALTPAFADWGAPLWLADVLGFVLALIVVTFLHLVVGEMAPKSWAIAHPERSAIALAIPMRGFLWCTRPALVALNSIANWCLRRVGVTPVDETADTQDPAGLRHLVEYSATVGTLDERYHGRLLSALEIGDLAVGDLLGTTLDGAVPEAVADVDAAAGPAEIRRAARACGHLRLAVRSGTDVIGYVHARDALTDDDVSAADLMRPVLRVAPTDAVPGVLASMRRERGHLAVVVDDTRVLGVVTLSDIVDRLLQLERV